MFYNQRISKDKTGKSYTAEAVGLNLKHFFIIEMLKLYDKYGFNPEIKLDLNKCDQYISPAVKHYFEVIGDVKVSDTEKLKAVKDIKVEVAKNESRFSPAKSCNIGTLFSSKSNREHVWSTLEMLLMLCARDAIKMLNTLKIEYGETVTTKAKETIKRMFGADTMWQRRNHNDCGILDQLQVVRTSQNVSGANSDTKLDFKDVEDILGKEAASPTFLGHAIFESGDLTVPLVIPTPTQPKGDKTANNSDKNTKKASGTKRSNEEKGSTNARKKKKNDREDSDEDMRQGEGEEATLVTNTSNEKANSRAIGDANALRVSIHKFTGSTLDPDILEKITRHYHKMLANASTKADTETNPKKRKKSNVNLFSDTEDEENQLNDSDNEGNDNGFDSKKIIEEALESSDEEEEKTEINNDALSDEEENELHDNAQSDKKENELNDNAKSGEEKVELEEDARSGEESTELNNDVPDEEHVDNEANIIEQLAATQLPNKTRGDSESGTLGSTMQAAYKKLVDRPTLTGEETTVFEDLGEPVKKDYEKKLKTAAKKLKVGIKLMIGKAEENSNWKTKINLRKRGRDLTIVGIQEGKTWTDSNTSYHYYYDEKHED